MILSVKNLVSNQITLHRVYSLTGAAHKLTDITGIEYIDLVDVLNAASQSNGRRWYKVESSSLSIKIHN